MRTVDAVDNEIRFTDTWDGLKRYVFIPDPFVSNDAGRTLCRDEAIAYVQANLDRYRAEARAQHGQDNPEKIVILRRSSTPSDASAAEPANDTNLSVASSEWQRPNQEGWELDLFTAATDRWARNESDVQRLTATDKKGG